MSLQLGPQTTRPDLTPLAKICQWDRPLEVYVVNKIHMHDTLLHLYSHYLSPSYYPVCIKFYSHLCFEIDANFNKIFTYSAGNSLL